MRHLIKDLEWQDDSYVNGLDDIERIRIYAESPTHSYLISDEPNDKYSVLKTRFRDKHTDYCTGFTSIKSAQEFSQDDFEKKVAVWLNPDPLTDTVNWFKEAKPEPTNKDVCTQIGCHYEEVGEMDLAIDNDDGISDNGTLAEWYKKVSPDMADYVLTEVNRTELLDALADQIVTAVGVAYMMGFDIIGALSEVNASNWSKFENGKAVTDDNGKIIKGSGYFKPELEKYLGGSDD